MRVALYSRAEHSEKVVAPAYVVRSLAAVQTRTGCRLSAGYSSSVVITYRRTGGLFALFTLGAAALVATVLTVAVAGTLLIATAAIAAVALLGRAVLPQRWRNRAVPLVTPWPDETLEATVIEATTSPTTPYAVRMDGNPR